MGNSHFQFKQFTIEQDKTAMKVCTDACLFGAFAAENLPYEKVLDIGAGTGLLALQYAQKNPLSQIDAIEIEENAFAQAKDNIDNSKWSKHITTRHISLQEFGQYATHYGLIISNPPFYKNDLHSPNVSRNLAMHSTGLSLEEIFLFAQKQLLTEGKMALLLPYYRLQECKTIGSQYNFFLQYEISVRQTPKHNYFRTILVFSQQPTKTIYQEITIKNDQDQYSAIFTELLKDYYLFL